MSKYAQGKFMPKNNSKYVGKGDPTYRSSWEWAFMQFCDNNPAVLQWASESIKIPYRNPVTGKQTIYIPDFFIYYVDAQGKNHGELIEIKPSKETTMEAARSQRDKLSVAINLAKWAAARAFCAGQGLTFRIITENQLFQYNGKR